MARASASWTPVRAPWRCWATTAPTLLASPALLALSPAIPSGCARRRAKFLERGAGATREFDCPDPRGSVAALHRDLHASLVELSTGAFVIALLRDVTDRRHAEERLQGGQRPHARRSRGGGRDAARAPARRDPADAGVRAAWHVEPCERLGGDTLNVFALDRRRLGFFTARRERARHQGGDALGGVAARALCPYPHAGSVLVEPARGRHAAPRLIVAAAGGEPPQSTVPHGPQRRPVLTIVYGVLDDAQARAVLRVGGTGGAPSSSPRGARPQSDRTLRPADRAHPSHARY